MTSNTSDEFYIGWQGQAPDRIGSHVRKTVIFLSIFALVVAGLLAFAQHSIGIAVFEWGTHKTFIGILRTAPYPHLAVNQPGQSGGQSDYLLVAPFKHGLTVDPALNGQLVTLKGTLIFRGNQTMIEVPPDSIMESLPSDHASRITHHDSPTLDTQHSTRVTLRGEIVDSKCYFGVMNPGHLTPHRGCAVRCISGGIPPVLLVQQEDRSPTTYLLVSNDGSPVNKQVLDMVAEPVEITGDLVQQGSLKILRADPLTYRGLKK